MENRYRTLGDMVTEDFRRAELFKQAGLDFCCGGDINLQDSCRANNLDLDQLLAQLEELSQIKSHQGLNYNSWSLDFLCDYLVNTHHSYVKNTLPDLQYYVNKINEVHGENHPELREIATLFNLVSIELTQHLQAEEEVLFPAVKRLLTQAGNPEREIIQREISRMHTEHEFAGKAMADIRQLSHHYLVPADGCKTYQVCFEMLHGFEDDLHTHVHLENNILFKKALDL